jgi:hypothetical protein
MCRLCPIDGDIVNASTSQLEVGITKLKVEVDGFPNPTLVALSNNNTAFEASYTFILEAQTTGNTSLTIRDVRVSVIHECGAFS